MNFICSTDMCFTSLATENCSAISSTGTMQSRSNYFCRYWRIYRSWESI